ncbi:MAG TPA: multidrug ABC transporter ATP-binding protein [Lachnospiraceae bacterium]|nr:multidrug ABC transporter ATP-binding protein [Lachnospiraceae bacterium]
MIEIQHVYLQYHKQEILHDITFIANKGDITGLIGTNGSGKTMLMKCICGFHNTFTGKIFVQGKEIGKDIDFPENMGFIIETPGFLPYYSGYKNLLMLAKLKNKIGKDEIEQALQATGLYQDRNKLVKKYSLGMRQRLGLAQAFMENPEILILDEPFNGLDREGTQQMRSLLLNYKKEGKTILFTSHNREDIDILCDQVYEIENGQLQSL